MMKKLIYTILGFMIFFTSCKEDQLETYSGKPSVYFPEAEFSNSKHFSFGYVSAYIQDTIVRIPVYVTGATVDQDRHYALTVLDSSSMKEGVDFDFVNQDFKIKANTLIDTLMILLQRSEGLRKKELGLSLALKENQDFTTQISFQHIGTGSDAYKRYFTHMNIYANDIAGAPWFWDPNKNLASYKAYFGYLGDYSSKKFQLMIARYELDVAELTKDGYIPNNRIAAAWGLGMQAYLTEMKLKGTPILEDNGTEMKMGTSSQ